MVFAIDGTTITSGGYNSFGHTSTNQYWNWKDVSLGSLTLKKGFHTLTYTAKGNGINLDCFKLVTTYYGDVASAGVQITDNGTTTLEAETMKVTGGSYGVEAPTGDALALTSGGKSIGNVTKGSVFSIPFNLGKKATVNLVAVMINKKSYRQYLEQRMDRLTPVLENYENVTVFNTIPQKNNHRGLLFSLIGAVVALAIASAILIPLSLPATKKNWVMEIISLGFDCGISEDTRGLLEGGSG